VTGIVCLAALRQPLAQEPLCSSQIEPIPAKDIKTVFGARLSKKFAAYCVSVGHEQFVVFVERPFIDTDTPVRPDFLCFQPNQVVKLNTSKWIDSKSIRKPRRPALKFPPGVEPIDH
jgi:hypothetical protein